MDESMDIVMEELDSLKVIFPESTVDKNNRSCTIDIDVSLDSSTEIIVGDVQSAEVKSLPSLKIIMSLPAGYPESEPPRVEIDSEWLCHCDGGMEKIQQLYEELNQFWVDLKYSVLYSYIDYLSTQAEKMFELPKVQLTTNLEGVKLFDEITKFNDEKSQQIFNSETFSCEICYNDLKGLYCTRIPQCEHVFCNDCLSSHFSSAMQSGDFLKVCCPDIECTKKAYAEHKELLTKGKKYNFKSFASYDAEFFRLPLGASTLKSVFKSEVSDPVTRYLNSIQKYKMTEYQNIFPRRVSNCPRSHCQSVFIRKNLDDDLTICPECNFAFCNSCGRSWHGINKCPKIFIPDDIICFWIANNSRFDSARTRHPFLDDFKHDNPRLALQQVLARYPKQTVDPAATDYIDDLDMRLLREQGDYCRCPECKCYIEKFEGCNKVSCKMCGTNFCFLCEEIINVSLYKHFQYGPCAQRLFDGMAGV